METWQEDLLVQVGRPNCEHAVFDRLASAARVLGFEHCAYGFRMPYPLTRPQIVLLNDYPQAWRDRYAQANYLDVDPTVIHGLQSQEPIVWNQEMFAHARPLWDEARSFGLRHGWAQSCLDTCSGSLLTLARGSEALSEQELAAIEPRLRWLSHLGHLLLSRLLVESAARRGGSALTRREVEVLKWAADGKTASDISDLLALSENTIAFHMKNAIFKLGAANRTAAVVQAALLGLLT